MYTGPHIIKDGLVFGYDTGYGIADNDTTTRFYPGKPTINIVPLSLSNSSWFNEYSGGRTLRSETLFGQPAYEFKSNDGQIWISPFAFNNYDRSTNDLTLSVYAKNIGSSAASMHTYFGGDYSSDSLGNANYKSLPADNTWRRYSWTRFSSAMSANYLEFRTANTGVVISCPQLEIGRVVTPVVNGTRSNTASLIDLKETTDIDVSNVSFDSTGQPTFDGTNDYININKDFGTVNAYTFEWVENPGQTHKMPIAGRTNTNFYKYGAYSWRYKHGGTLGEYYHTTGATSGWHHWVVTYDGSTIKVFQDNISLGTNSSSSGTADFSDGFKIGWWSAGGTYAFNGDIPVMRIYDKALSSTEIKQNFNAYKNRFDI